MDNTIIKQMYKYIFYLKLFPAIRCNLFSLVKKKRGQKRIFTAIRARHTIKH